MRWSGNDKRNHSGFGKANALKYREILISFVRCGPADSDALRNFVSLNLP